MRDYKVSLLPIRVLLFHIPPHCQSNHGERHRVHRACPKSGKTGNSGKLRGAITTTTQDRPMIPSQPASATETIQNRKQRKSAIRIRVWENRNILLRIATRTCCVLFILCQVFITSACDELKPKQKPPISISFRKSLLFDGEVLQVRNNSSSALSCLLFVENKTLGQAGSWWFNLNGNSTYEIGGLEVNWRFMHGEKGRIKVEGFSDVYFTVP